MVEFESEEYWGLAQLVARQILTLKVKGSRPLSPAKVGALRTETVYQPLKRTGRRF